MCGIQQRCAKAFIYIYRSVGVDRTVRRTLKYFAPIFREIITGALMISISFIYFILSIDIKHKRNIKNKFQYVVGF